MPRKLLVTIVAAAAVVGCASAGSAQDGVLRIGMIANDGGDGIAGLGDIRTAYERATGTQVRVFAASNQASLIEAHADGRIHYAILSASGFVAAQRLCGCVEPLAAPVGAAGDAGLRAVVLARAGGPASLMETASGRIIAGPGTVPGPQLLAMDALSRAGAGDNIVLADTVETAELAFARGDANVLLGWEASNSEGKVAGGSAPRLAALGLAPHDFSVIWRSDAIRYGPHTVRSELSDTMKERLRNFLVGLHAQNPKLYDLLERDHLGGFAATGPGEYATATAMVELAIE